MMLLLPLFLAAHAVAQQDCHQACSISGGPALCGTSCTYVDPSSGLLLNSFCGSAQFPLCTPPPPPPSSAGVSAYSGSTQVSSFLDPTGVTTGKPAGQSIFYRATDQHVHHIYSNTTWQTDDPTGMTSSIAAVSGTSISSFLDPTGVTTGKPAGQSIFYVGTDQHVHHVYSNTTWHADDPTAMTGAPLAAPGAAITSFLDPTGVNSGGVPSQAIFYIATDQHIHHFFTDTTWHTDDATAFSGAPPAATGSPLCAFLDSAGGTTGGPGQAIFYIGTDQHIHHIYSNTTWHNDDPTALAGAPLAIAGSSISCFVDPTGVTTGKPAGQSSNDS